MSPGIDGRRWSEICTAFEALVDLDPEPRAARLQAISRSDPDLCRSVEKLLAADAEAESRLAALESAFVSPAGPDAEAVADTDPLRLVGRTISHFKVTGRHASGGMGIVYRAEDAGLRRSVALKFPLYSSQLDSAAKERFLNEARAAAALDHPNVCSIYEAGEADDGWLFLAMPLYDGETLKERLAREGALSHADAIAIAQQIARGLGAAHEVGIVHRDIKPANVMLLRDGSVKILDFGLAKVRDLTFTNSRTRLGTVSYMAPEQIQGRDVDARTDLWALGVVLYEMLTGHRPFDGEYDVAIAHAIVHSDPKSPAALRSEIPQDVDGIVQRLLSRDPARRFQSAEQLTAALSAVVPADAAPPELPARGRVLSNFARRRSTRLASALIVFATMLLGAWLVTRNAGNAANGPITIAVFPIEYRNSDPDGRYLAVGLTDGIASELSRVRAVVVPFYLSVFGYGGPATTEAEIAQDLGARAILKASVERVGDSVRVNAQLFEAGAARPSWSQHYVSPASDLRDLQGRVARAVLKKVRVNMSADERALLQRPPSTNAQAYDLYLRGRAAELSGYGRFLQTPMPTENIRQALSLYSRARDLDPNFALARAQLARMHMRSAGANDRTQARRDQGRLEAEAALRIEPGLPLAHEALSAYWSAVQDRTRSAEELKRALAGTPNSAALHVALGYIYARLGRLEDAVVEFDRAMQLDRSSPNDAFIAALFYLRLRREEPTMRAFDRALALAPDYHLAKTIKGHTILRWYGTPDTVAALLRTIPPDWDPNGQATYARFSVLRVQRRYRDALAMLEAAPSQFSRDDLLYHPKALLRAELYDDLNEDARARVHYETARRILADSAKAHPNGASIHAALGLALAGLGRKQEAIAAARRAMSLTPLSQNAPAATAFMGTAVEVFAKVGEVDAALELLDLLFSAQAGREVTPAYLRIWPGFDPLRSDPRFEQLIERFATS